MEIITKWVFVKRKKFRVFREYGISVLNMLFPYGVAAFEKLISNRVGIDSTTI